MKFLLGNEKTVPHNSYKHKMVYTNLMFSRGSDYCDWLENYPNLWQNYPLQYLHKANKKSKGVERTI